MTVSVEIHPCGPVHGSIRPPGSKSITNRALICAALAEGRSELRGALDSEDTRVLIAALGELGHKVAHDTAANSISLDGCAGRIPKTAADLFLANSGTSIRFLTAMTTVGHGTFRLDGVPRMRQRPIGDLLDALQRLGADAISEAGNGCPPVLVRANGLPGGATSIRGDISSQFLSGLMLAAPYTRHGVTLAVEGELVSQPYVRMTAAVMASFGIAIDARDLTRFVIPPGVYRGCRYEIEPDASAASYFWATAAIAGGSVRVEGLGRDSLQGDVAFCDVLQRMGCRVEWSDTGTTVHGPAATDPPLRGIDIDMNAISDTVQTLAAVALFADGPTTIRGVAHNRHKETDRIADLARELRKLGAAVEELPDGLRITPGPPRPAIIETYHDHRMAMSLSLVGLRTAGIVITNPRCTEKTYPAFFDDLRRLIP